MRIGKSLRVNEVVNYSHVFNGTKEKKKFLNKDTEFK